MIALATWIAAAAIATGSTAPAFQTQDVMGRAIEVPVAGHPVLLCFEGRATAESAANVLTTAAYDPKSKIPEFKVCAMRIDKPGAEGGAGRKRMERRGLART